MKLAASNVRTIAAPGGKSDHIEWDSALPGFGLRLRGRNRSYVIQYRVGKQQRRESLGDVRRVTLEAARDIARKRFAQVELGKSRRRARQGTRDGQPSGTDPQERCGSLFRRQARHAAPDQR